MRVMAIDNLPTLIIVGGFLGAGKTTLIFKAVDLLRRRGKRVAVIMNDQDAGLVDTQHALARDITVREVTGGCFCCRFSEFAAMANELAAQHPDVIFAEPVGSCIDLTATVVRPLQAILGDQLRVAPLTVLLDPQSAAALEGNAIDSDLHYLMTHQLAEADLVCTTKCDLHQKPAQLPFPIDFELSGKTGQAVEDWLNEMLQTTRVVGTRFLDVDYTRYAEAEAALGWLNVHARLELASPQTPALLCGPLLDRLEATLTDSSITIAHLKIFDRTPASWLKASILANGSEPVPEGDLLAEPAGQHDLAVNLRALADPERLRELVLAALADLPGRINILHLAAFRPPPPEPEHRLPAGVP